MHSLMYTLIRKERGLVIISTSIYSYTQLHTNEYPNVNVQYFVYAVVVVVGVVI